MDNLMKLNCSKRPKSIITDTYELSLLWKYRDTNTKNKLIIATESIVLDKSAARFVSTLNASEILEFVKNATEVDILKIEALIDSTFNRINNTIHELKDNYSWYIMSVAPYESVARKGQISYRVKLESKSTLNSKNEEILSQFIPDSTYGPLCSNLHIAAAFIMSAYELKHVRI